MSDTDLASDDDVSRKLARLAALEAATSELRHDLRGILAPALLVADRLLMHDDVRVVKAAEKVVTMVKRAEARLQETKAAIAP